MRRLLVVLALLAGCGSLPQWPHRPVPVRLAANIPDACAQAVERALEFWARQGVDYLEPTAEVGAYGVLVRHRDLPADQLGQADRVPGVAVLTLEECSLQNAAHELGHALGLGHHPDRWNLMHPTTVGGVNLRLTPEQLDLVR